MGQHWTFWLGLLLALGAAVMLWDGGVFGDRTAPAAVTLLIVGLALIATGNRRTRTGSK
ncbi:hypothetical protein [Haloarchaeobius sp. HME9146]|uniref:hypothetical protein n=1 Tax=Haloarchaeobius sp. HME9146 TaxID=2978732 RepID=UPI0021C24326|nr:hypothetical protein [Haloarchaeobius sp. HME9146]MCT9097669.1 hypothetical protein [Haloarchaeobius sp. HME9146]